MDPELEPIYVLPHPDVDERVMIFRRETPTAADGVFRVEWDIVLARGDERVHMFSYPADFNEVFEAIKHGAIQAEVDRENAAIEAARAEQEANDREWLGME